MGHFKLELSFGQPVLLPQVEWVQGREVLRNLKESWDLPTHLDQPLKDFITKFAGPLEGSPIPMTSYKPHV